MAARLLAIDDEPAICEFVRNVAVKLGFAVTTTHSPREFRSLCRDEKPEIVVLDLVIPGTDGIELLRQMAEDGSQAKLVIMSGADPRILQAAKRLGEANKLHILATLEKPLRLLDLSAVLAKAIRKDDPVTESALRAAIENHEFVVHFQPKIDLKATRDVQITGAEALVRWQRPGSKLVYPDAFIPLAEQSGLIGDLTRQVLSQALRQVRAWEDEGLSLSIAVNLSPHLLGDLSLPNQIFKALAEAGIAPSRLTLEITESGAMLDAVRTMEILTRFRLKGFGLSIDDFGTGYSSLVQLHRMPFNEMKIDKSFTMEIDRDDEARKIVASITDLAQSLGVSLCAEGVEKEAHLDYLQSIGCDTAQGYFFSKPVPAAKFVKLLRR